MSETGSPLHGPKGSRAWEDQLGTPVRTESYQPPSPVLGEVSCVFLRLNSGPRAGEAEPKESDQCARGLGVRTGGLLPL